MTIYRRAVITGAASGIGTAFAEALPRSTDLMITGRAAERLDEVRERLMRKGRTIETVVADLADPAGIDALVGRAEAFDVDLLINNAGLGYFGPVLDNPEKIEREAVMVNVVAVHHLTRALAPGMIRRADVSGMRAGIIIVSSTAAFAPVPYFATYAATKAFDLHFAEALAEELRNAPIDVLALCPGMTRTDFGRRAGYGGGPVPGSGEPSTVAREGLSALGERAVHVTGRINQAGFAPLLLPRRAVNRALGVAMRVVNRGSRC